MVLPTAVKLVEVGARDGLQNEPTPVPTAVKIELRVATFDSPITGDFICNALGRPTHSRAARAMKARAA